jgi:hypothetical protein
MRALRLGDKFSLHAYVLKVYSFTGLMTSAQSAHSHSYRRPRPTCALVIINDFTRRYEHDFTQRSTRFFV